MINVKVVMLKTCRGSEDGITSQIFKEGEQYEISESLALSFFKGGEAKKAPVFFEKHWETKPEPAPAQRGRPRKD